jgi:GT2 family glycosyltransferase
VIVVDNASTDGAAEMVRREFPEVILIRNTTNQGFARANNQAVALARGHYLFFLNNDTVTPPGALGQLMDFTRAHPEAGMIGPRLRDATGHIQVSYRSRPSLGALLHRTTLLRWTGLFYNSYRNYRRDAFDPEKTRQVDVLMGAALLVRRDRFLGWGGWDEDFPFGGEDLELSARIGARAPLLYCPAVEVLHHGRASTRQYPPALSWIALGWARYLRKAGTPWTAVMLYKAIVTLDAPLTLLLKAGEYALRRLQGREEKAQKSLRSVQVAWHFLTCGLIDFWRA